MTKICVYGLIDEEKQFLIDWAEENDVELDLHYEDLTAETVHLAEGADGVTCMQMEYVKEPVYSTLKSYGIKNIAQRSAGFDMYDLEAATANDIIVTNVPSYSPESIAEFAVYSALRIIRKIDLVEERVKDYNFTWQEPIMSRPVNEMTVAILGVGRIGSRVAKIFKDGFGAKVVAYDIEPRAEFEKWVEYKATPEEAIKDADIVTLHMPLNDLNFQQVNEEFLKTMKKGSVLVNTARGKIVNTRALIDAVDSGHLLGAALDVYENEHAYVPKDWSGRDLGDDLFDELINHPKIYYTQHIAYYTDTAVKNIAEGGLQSTLDVIQTGDSDTRVN